MIKAILLVPMLDNDGNPFPEEMFLEVEERLLIEFGGWTFAGVVKGAWLHENRIYQDKCRRYEVALSEEIRQKLREIAQWIKQRFEQEAVYLEWHTATQVEII